MRARNIKPGFWRNEQLVEQPFQTRLLFIGLWNLADREGRVENRPKKIKLEIFPADDVDISLEITRLSEAGLVKVYEAEGVKCIEVVNFKKHQNPHHREAESELPPVPENNGTDPQPPENKEASESPGKAQGKPEESRADSGFLNPDSPSLIPEEQPCATEAAPDISAEVISYLNEKANRNYRNAPTNTKLILARAKEGATLEDFKAVIDRKCKEWAGNPGMAQYLRPATLFNAEKFNQYIGQLGAPMPTSNLLDGTSRFSSRHNGFDQRDYSEGLIEGVSDDAANF